MKRTEVATSTSAAAKAVVAAEKSILNILLYAGDSTLNTYSGAQNKYTSF